jgi:LysM repeat protein
MPVRPSIPSTGLPWRRARGVRLAALLVGLALVLLGPARAQAQEGATGASADSVHVVQEGETLYSIAQRYGVSVRALQTWNDLSSTQIEVGQRLRVRPPGASAPTRPDTTAAASPSDPASSAPPSDTVASPARRAQGAPRSQPVPDARTLIDGSIDPLRFGTHVVKAGDTFYSVAQRYGTSADTLFALNAQTTASLEPGTVLRLPPRFATPSHVVQEGETLFQVAGRYGVSVKTLQRVNGLDGTDVAAGRRLQIPGRRAPSPAPPGTLPDTLATGPVVKYPSTFEGRLMAGGRRYDPSTHVVSHPDLPIGTVVLLTHTATGRHAFAVVADRGPLDEAFLLDVSAAVARRLGLPADADESEAPVVLRVVEPSGEWSMAPPVADSAGATP